eukprot:5048421-Amphidinium_carterae.1
MGSALCNGKDGTSGRFKISCVMLAAAITLSCLSCRRQAQFSAIFKHGAADTLRLQLEKASESPCQTAHTPTSDYGSCTTVTCDGEASGLLSQPPAHSGQYQSSEFDGIFGQQIGFAGLPYGRRLDKPGMRCSLAALTISCDLCTTTSTA